MIRQFSNTDPQILRRSYSNPRVLPATAMVLFTLGCGAAAGPAGSAHPKVGDKLATLELRGLPVAPKT